MTIYVLAKYSSGGDRLREGPVAPRDQLFDCPWLVPGKVCSIGCDFVGRVPATLRPATVSLRLCRRTIALSDNYFGVEFLLLFGLPNEVNSDKEN